MGAFLDKPKTDKTNESGKGNGVRYGISSMQGWRVEMEDAHCAVTDVPDLPGWSFFAVFDGHAGAKVSAHSAQHLLHTIVNSDDWKESFDGADSGPSLEHISKAIKTGFLKIDQQMRELPEVASGEDKSGSTAICLLVSPDHLFFSNLGDSRAVHSRDGKVVFNTEDHKPSNPPEKQRIENAGGSVMIQRVNGSLAVSRALGDFEYKRVAGMGPCDQLVSPEPETTDEERCQTDEFVVLACDGIWDVMSNEELGDFVRSRMLITDDLSEICNQVVDTCLHKGSRDNMSIVIVAFSGAPKVSEEAVKREAELDALIEERVKCIVTAADPEDVDIPYVMFQMSKEDIPHLPPGGELHAKRQVIENKYYELLPNRRAEVGNSH